MGAPLAASDTMRTSLRRPSCTSVTSKRSKELGFDFAVTPWTLSELRTNIARSRREIDQRQQFIRPGVDLFAVGGGIFRRPRTGNPPRALAQIVREAGQGGPEIGALRHAHERGGRAAELLHPELDAVALGRDPRIRP
jgi:hypothetical protein